MVAVLHAFVNQRIAFSQTDPGRRQAGEVVRQQRGEAPVVAVGGGAHILLEQPGDARLFQQKALGKALVRGRVLVRCATRVEQQLQAQRQAGVTRAQRTLRRQRAARAVATDGDARSVQPQRSAVLRHPDQVLPGVLGRGREFVRRRQTVIQRDHSRAGQPAQLAAQHIVGIDAAQGEAAAMKVQQHRQPGLGGRRVKPRRQRRAVAGRDRELLHPGQGRARQLQHLGAHGVGCARLTRWQAVHGRVGGTGDAFEHALHRGRQQMVGRTVAHGAGREEGWYRKA